MISMIVIIMSIMFMMFCRIVLSVWVCCISCMFVSGDCLSVCVLLIDVLFFVLLMMWCMMWWMIRCRMSLIIM